MSRHKRVKSLEDDEPKLDVSSLIDATFLLLAYFLVTTTILPREQDLQMKLPSPNPTDEMPELDPMLIRVEPSGAIFVGSPNSPIPMDSDPDSRELPLLTEDLARFKQSADVTGKDPIVQIYVDGAAQQQRVVDVLNALAGQEIDKVTFTDLVDP